MSLARILFLVLLTCVASCSRKSPPREEPPRSVRWAIESLPERLEWADCDASCDAIAPFLMEGLTRETPGSLAAIEPAAAERWEWRGGRRLRVFLRPEAKWSDGSAVTARDFVSAWESYLGARQSAKRAARLFCSELSATGARIRAASELEIVVTFPRACPQFLRSAARPELYPRRGSATNGPYRLEEWSAGRLAVLSRSPYGARASPWPDTLVLRADPDPARRLARFGNGEADFVDGLTWRDVPDWQAFRDQILTYQESRLTLLALPTESRGGLPAPWRRAILTSADPEPLVQRLRWPHRPLKELEPLVESPGSEGWAALPGLASMGSIFTSPLRPLLRVTGHPLRIRAETPDARAVAEALAVRWVEAAGVAFSVTREGAAAATILDVAWEGREPESLLGELAKVAEQLFPGAGAPLVQAATQAEPRTAIAGIESRLMNDLAVLRPLFQTTRLAAARLGGPPPRRTRGGAWDFSVP